MKTEITGWRVLECEKKRGPLTLAVSRCGDNAFAWTLEFHDGMENAAIMEVMDFKSVEEAMQAADAWFASFVEAISRPRQG